MNNCVTHFPHPVNEPVRNYEKGSSERVLLDRELKVQMETPVEIPIIINGKHITTDHTETVACPHDHRQVLGLFHKAGEPEVKLAISAALEAKKEWEIMPFQERASIFLKAAELISGKYRYILNAATMLNQSKNAYQAEIDATCELADFLRFNVNYMEQIYSIQPESGKGSWNRMEYRPLEGFVFALTPFNFTAIAGNLITAPAMMGNTVVWKPASSAVLSGYYLMQLFKQAGLPDGVINFIPGNGSEIGNYLLADRHLAGVHFTGSTTVFNHIWESVGRQISNYKSYPRLVGETGGKDFIFMHPSADIDQVAAAAVRGAFEYQGQKCSACSRMYVPKSRWAVLKEKILSFTLNIKTGSVLDYHNFCNAVIDEKAFDTITGFIKRATLSDDAEVIAGGTFDKSTGYFIDPTIIVAKDPGYESMREEIFGPVLTIYIYDDNQINSTLELLDKTSKYALTGSVFANDRAAINTIMSSLTYSAGNFYINDKPTGAVVGQQPFGGSRASGTNDKAGSYLNLLRWTSPRTIKENLAPPIDIKYPFMT